jgi:hypothetical protein
MSFAPALHKAIGWLDPVQSKVFGQKFSDSTDLAYQAFKPKTPPAPPGVPNPNDAMNAAQQQTDAMRMRRGLMSNIYAGSLQGQASQPVSGKTALGT